MIARLESSKDISCILKKLTASAYKVTIASKREAFLYKQGLNSNSLRSDIRSAKESCKYTSSINIIYGSNSIFM